MNINAYCTAIFLTCISLALLGCFLCWIADGIKNLFSRKSRIKNLENKIESQEEEIADLEDKIESQTAEIDFIKSEKERITKDRDKLSGEISELRKRNVHLESLNRVQNIDTALKEQAKKHTAEKNAKNDEIAELEQQIRSLQAQLQLQAPNNSKINFEKEQLAKCCSELRADLIALKTEIKKPRDYKFKYTRIESLYVNVNGKSRPADFSFITYSIYAVDDKTNKLKRIKQSEYFLERFYWRENGYASFDPPIEIPSDGTPIRCTGTKGITYTVSFKPEYKVKPWDVSVKHVSVIRRLTSKTLSNAIGMFEKFSKLFKKYDDHFEKLQIVSEEFDKLNEEFKLLQKDYNENIKKLESDAKKAKDRFNEKFEKYSKG